MIMIPIGFGLLGIFLFFFLGIGGIWASINAAIHIYRRHADAKKQEDS